MIGHQKRKKTNK